MQASTVGGKRKYRFYWSVEKKVIDYNDKIRTQYLRVNNSREGF